MNLEPQNSGLIAALGFDAERQILRVQFRKSKKQLIDPQYDYQPFTAERFAELKASAKSEANPEGSVGRYFLMHIKTDASLTCTRVMDDAQ